MRAGRYSPAPVDAFCHPQETRQLHRLLQFGLFHHIQLWFSQSLPFRQFLVRYRLFFDACTPIAFFVCKTYSKTTYKTNAIKFTSRAVRPNPATDCHL